MRGTGQVLMCLIFKHALVVQISNLAFHEGLSELNPIKDFSMVRQPQMCLNN